MSARDGFHLSTWAMFPWINPTRIGSPWVRRLAAIRWPPQIDVPAMRASVAMSATARARPVASAVAANPAFTSATKADSPKTPIRLANCTIGSSVTMVLPSGIQGKPPIRNPRVYSVATQAAGASVSPAKPKRRMRMAEAADANAVYVAM